MKEEEEEGGENHFTSTLAINTKSWFSDSRLSTLHSSGQSLIDPSKPKECFHALSSSDLSVTSWCNAWDWPFSLSSTLRRRPISHPNFFFVISSSSSSPSLINSICDIHELTYLFFFPLVHPLCVIVCILRSVCRVLYVWVVVVVITDMYPRPSLKYEVIRYQII